MIKLNKNGILAVQIPMNGQETLFKIMNDVISEPQWNFSAMKIETNETLLPEEYFDIWETVYYHNMPSVDAMVEWIKGTRMEVIIMSYLFVHFKEKYTEDGEQIYFALSKDGYIWEAVKNGNPVLTATKGDMGVRDITITRTSNNEFIIMATDLALVRNINTKYGGDIRNAFRYGSKAIAMWKSKDLINWTEEILLEPGDSALGCFWAPGIFYEDVSGEYIIHWSSSTSEDDYSGLAIYYSLTKNFENFSEPKLFYKKQDSELLDSFICKSNNTYHFFVKSAKNPKAVIHETSSSLLGPYIRDTNFDEQMSTIENCGAYEAPMVYKLSDGRFCLMLDFYGCERKEDMGYVPFLTDSLDDVKLNMAKDKFVFPYGFKHGVVMEITDAEYESIKKS